MAQDPIILIIHTVGQIYAFILILRFLLQVAGADYYNPISQAVVRITGAPLKPLQKLLPRAGRIDLSPLLLAFVVYGLTLVAMMLVKGIAASVPMILLYSAVTLLDSILQIYFWTVIAAVIISWIAPDSYHPAPQLILQITEPLFKLARKVIPPIGGLDLSPILIFLLIQILRSQLAPFTF
ncbi:YggT family protein [Marinobacterium sp. D7]|uniref:YggT family protein n=1 Tax=Marinobacterium ramblicola TaxID=2849041 RepID=UPI001C2D61BF|nr:YggT family protein [Marinobacterium ramblicola]MBV1788388.1 YggT family protein [Marinobacterium ramblicola]